MPLKVDPDIIKSFLRVDPEEDTLLCQASAEQYLVEAVGTGVDWQAPLTVMVVAAFTQEFYDKRELTGDENKSRLRHVYSSVLDQIRLNITLADEAIKSGEVQP